MLNNPDWNSLFLARKNMSHNKFMINKLIEANVKRFWIINILILQAQARHHSIHIKVVKFMVKILPIWFSTMWSYCLSSYFRWFMIHVFSLYDVHAFGIQSSRKMCCCSFTNYLIYSLPTIKNVAKRCSQNTWDDFHWKY